MIKASRIRTAKEKIYFFVLLLVSLSLWFFIFRSIGREFGNLGRLVDVKSACYDRDPQSRKFVVVDRNLLFRGEACHTIDDLPQAEKTEVIKSGGVAAADVNGIFSFPFVIVLLILFGIFSFILTLGQIRLNSIKIGPGQFPSVYDAVGKLSKKLGFKKQPDVFVMMGNGVLNAFAAKLIARKLLVIYSDLAEALLENKNQGQLEAALSHELGHHALGHTSWWMWILEPGMLIPFLGSAYSRQREYSADRIMRSLVDDQDTCDRALVKLAAGKRLGQETNIDAFVDQAIAERGFFSWFAEKVATHPHLAHRIIAIRKWGMKVSKVSEVPTTVLRR